MQDVIMAVMAIVIAASISALFFLKQNPDEIIAQRQKEEILRKYAGIIL